MTTANTNTPAASIPGNFKRRNFLLTAGLGLGAAAAAIGVKALIVETSAPAAIDRQAKDKGYQATEHVRNYYRTARI